jgi:hypothetical protein
MRRNALLATLAASALIATSASAQQVRTRDHRKKAPPAAAAPDIKGFGPARGPAGTVVTIRGNDLPDAASIVIGGKRISVKSANGTISFEVPDLEPGKYDIDMRANRNVYKIGEFNLRPVRDRGGKDGVHTRDHRDGKVTEVVPVNPNTKVVDRPTTAVVGPAGKRPHMGRGRDRWRRHDRAIVTGYRPKAGKSGTRVVVRGENFADGTVVVYGDQEIAGAKIKPNRIVFEVPDGAASGAIALRIPRTRRALAVGNFEVKDYDYEKERKRLAEERRREAEARWKQQRSELAKDRAGRIKAWKDRERELEDTRTERRARRVEEIRARWKAAFLADEDTVAELALHSERVARLERMRRVALYNDKGKLVVRVDVLLARENARHEERMVALEANFKLAN